MIMNANIVLGEICLTINIMERVAIENFDYINKKESRKDFYRTLDIGSIIKIKERGSICTLTIDKIEVRGGDLTAVDAVDDFMFIGDIDNNIQEWIFYKGDEFSEDYINRYDGFALIFPSNWKKRTKLRAFIEVIERLLPIEFFEDNE